MNCILRPLLLLALAVPGWGQTNFLRYPPCSVPVVELITETPMVKRGTAPTFTLVLSNDGNQAVRLIDVRKSRWQIHHAALEFLQGDKEVVDLMVPISDPPAVKPDYFWLQPGGKERFTLHYEQDATELRPDTYEAVVVFWDFYLPSARSSGPCLSNRVKFTVK